MSITQVIPQFTKVPNKLLSPEEFRADADSFFSEIDAYVASINNWSTQANALRNEVNVINNNVNAKNTNVNQKASETASNAQIAETAKNTILSYVVPTSATYSPETIDSKNNIQNKSIFVSGGFTTTETKKSDRWLETNTPNVIIDKKSDDVVFNDGVYSRLGEELVTNGDFNDGTTGWTSQNATLSIENGMIKVYSNVSVGSAVAAIQHITRTVGKKYILSFSSKSGNVGNSIEVRQISGTAYYNNIGDGEHSYIIDGNTSDFQVFFRPSVVDIGNYCYFDNISVREVQQFELPEAPFAGSNDELLDDKVDGLATQQAHSKGDVVVTGNELVVNGTFDSDTAWIKTRPWTISGGVASMSSSSAYEPLYQDISMIAGKEYVVVFDIVSISGSIKTNAGNGASYSTYTTTGTKTEKITAIDSTLGFSRNTNGSTVVIDNVSVKLADNVYQAKVNNPSTDLTSTDWQVLPNLDGIQDINLIRKHKATKAIDTYSYRSINSWNETHSNDDIMIGEGFSKVSGINDVYEDSNYEYIFVGFANRLNALKYHPVYNSTGEYKNNSNENWYEANNILSLYNCSLNIGINNGRPDSKEADKIYLNQLIDRCMYALPMGEEEMLRWAKARELDYAEDREVECNEPIKNTVQLDTWTTVASTPPRRRVYTTSSQTQINQQIKTKYFEGGEYERLYAINNTSGIAYEIVNILNQTNGFYMDFHPRYGNTFTDLSSLYTIFGIKKSNKISQGTKTSIDVIGDPSNYPSDWLSHLASGKSVGFNPLLVSDTGDSLLPDGSNKEFKLSNKFTDTYSFVFTSDSGSSYTTGSIGFGMNSILNSYTNGIGAVSVAIAPYTSLNKPFQESNPKPITYVKPSVIATNSHSIYKNAMITFCATDKIPTVDNSNDLEGKNLENTIGLNYDEYVFADGSVFNYTKGYKYYFDGFDNYSGIYVATDTNAVFANPNLATVYGFMLQSTIPRHSEFTLNNINSSACKFYEAIAEDENGVYRVVKTKELVYNTGTSSYDGDNELFDDSTTDLNGNSIKNRTLIQRLPIRIRK